MKSFSFNADFITAAFTEADTDTSIFHRLDRIPLAAFVISPDTSAARIYKGSVAWTATTISLRSNTANRAVSLLVV